MDIRLNSTSEINNSFSFFNYNNINVPIKCNLNSQCTNEIIWLLQKEFLYKNKLFISCFSLLIIINLIRIIFPKYYKKFNFVFGVGEGFSLVYGTVWIIDLFINPY